MIGSLTKELAKQALGGQMKEVVDSLRPPDLASVAESLTGNKPAVPPQEAPLGAVILGQIQAMQNALKEDQELMVLCGAGAETLRVLEIFAPSWKAAVLTGIDTDKVVTRFITPFDMLQLVCKPVPVQADAKPVRVKVIGPKP